MDRLALDQYEHCSLEIFDIEGRSVATLLDSELFQGEHSVSWDGCRQSGDKVSAGLYLCRIESGGVIETTGLCLLR
ncbi:MAG: hypothetical protein K8S62_01680 [Candidatus Sabulitectum sp.]|nr:hypothetical protein [Candidatus Sabulitectum sp.]